ncbi:MAG: flagellar filament capping protein FliD [Nitrococcus sp.]|nr:flagellar filament capping protein FliD [Nitrococcus sp.]
MPTISSSGLASGLDVNSIIEKLINAERAPRESRLNLHEARAQAKISAIGTLKSGLNDFRSAIADLQQASTFSQRMVTSSNEDLIAVSPAQGGIAGRYSVTVEQLAAAQSLASAGYESVDSAVGTGTLTIRFGTTTYDPGAGTYAFEENADRSAVTLEIDASNNTLSGIRDAINEADAGVRASVVNDGSGFRLVLTSEETGAENSLQIEVADADFDAATNSDGHTDAAGLSALAFNAQAQQLEQTVAAQDARVSVDGLAITRPSNTISGVIDGASLDLEKAESGTPVTVSVSQDEAAVKDAISQFVEAYNTVVTELDTLTAYDPEQDQAGVLQGSALARTVERSLRDALHTIQANAGGALGSLAELGITTRTSFDGEGVVSGSLALDEDKLDAALSAHFDEVAQLFAATGDVSSDNLRFVAGTDETAAGTYPVNVTQAATQGRITGTALADPLNITIDAANDEIALSVDGEATGILTLTQGSYTAETLAAELESQINAVDDLHAAGITASVSVADGQLTIASNRYGSASSVEIVSVDSTTAATLGLSVGPGSAGSDVAGSIGGIIAAGDGRLLRGSGAAEGLSIEVTGADTGIIGSVTFYRGVADRMTRAVDRLLADGGILDTRDSRLQDQMDDIGEQRVDLASDLEDLEERYRAQFTRLDLVISELNKTSAFLSQQLDALPGFGGQDNED